MNIYCICWSFYWG